MEKLITHVSLFRFGVRQFTDEVNAYLKDGWSITILSIGKVGWFRVLCYALLIKEED